MKKLALITLLSLSLSVSAVEIRNFPTPETISPELQKVVTRVNKTWNTAPQTQEEWWDFAESFAANNRPVVQALAQQYNVTIEDGSMAGVHIYTVTPPQISPEHQNQVLLFFHGGGYVFGKDYSSLTEAVLVSALGKYKIIAVDYRLAPKYPYPAAIEDGFAVYKELIKTIDPKNIGVFGTSAGGGMTLILGLQIKDNNLPMPAALAPLTPWSQMGDLGDSYKTNEGVDNSIVSYSGWLDDVERVYANGNDINAPYLSPINGDVSGFPPTLLVSGTRDLFLSNTVRMQEKLLKADVETNLIVYEAQSHAQYYLAPASPEAKFHVENLTKFFDKYLENK